MMDSTLTSRTLWGSLLARDELHHRFEECITNDLSNPGRGAELAQRWRQMLSRAKREHLAGHPRWEDPFTLSLEHLGELLSDEESGAIAAAAAQNGQPRRGGQGARDRRLANRLAARQSQQAPEEDLESIDEGELYE